MAKVTGSNPPVTDWQYTDATGESHFFGEFFRKIFKGLYPSQTDPETDITGQSSRGIRPSEQGIGTAAQEPVRDRFLQCTELWHSLPEECPETITDPPTTSKKSVWDAKVDFGVPCSYYDLFMRCCLKWAESHDGEMPQGDCFPCPGQECSCEGVSIGYTSDGMSGGESQYLVVMGAVQSCTYTWAIISGGGSLDVTEGDEVEYTAPTTNPYCANNPTIGLYVNEELCDTLTLAINTANIDAEVVRVYAMVYECANYVTGNYYPNTGLCDGDYIYSLNARMSMTGYNCDGSVRNTCAVTGTTSTTDMKNGDGNFYLCNNETDRATACSILMNKVKNYNCIGIHSFQDRLDISPVDERYSWMIADGCCPPQLI